MKIFTLILCLTSLMATAQVPTGSLVGYWPFTGNANDLSGNSNNGSVYGATLTADRFGNCNSAYSFDGINDNVIVPNSAFVNMTNTTNFSVCFWMNTSPGFSGIGTVLCKNTYGLVSGYQFFANNGFCSNSRFTFYNSGNITCSTNSIMGAGYNNTWIFVTGIYNYTASAASIYVNGVYQSSVTTNGFNLSTSASLFFGSQTNNTEFYKGRIDDIRIYKRILNQSEITALFNEPDPGPSPGNVTAVSSTSVLCSGQTATLTASGATSYTWMPGGIVSPTIAVSPTTTTSYSIVGSGTAACLTAGTFTQNVLQMNLTATSATICSGQNAILSANGANTYTWSNGALTSTTSVSPAATTVYTVSGTTGSCTDSETVSVNVTPGPSITFNNAVQSICSGASATISASGAVSYSWSNGSNSASISVNPLVNTVYTLSASNGTCTTSQTAAINVTSSPTVSVNNATICSGNSVLLTANGAGSYSWSTGAFTNTVVVSPTVTTTYSVQGSNGSCLDAEITTVSVAPTPTVILSNNPVQLCAGQTATLVVSGAATYSWNTGPTTSSIAVSPASTTIYTVTGFNGACSAMTTATVQVVPSPTLNLSPSSTLICTNQSVTIGAEGALTYTWQPGNINTPSITDSLSVTTIYTLTATGANGCTTTQTIEIIVSTCDGIDVAGHEAIKFRVFPNPATDEVTFNFENADHREIDFQIFDGLGKNVMTKGIVADDNAFQSRLNISNLSKGIYFVRISFATKATVTVKLIKE